MEQLNKLLKKQNWGYKRRMNYIARRLHWKPAMLPNWWMWVLKQMGRR